MAYFEIPENPDYNDKIEKLTPETRGHADVWNVIYQRIIENIAYIHNAVGVLKGSGDGSVTKLIAEEVAKIIADAPEDFDTLKEISDWIENHQGSAAAMNSAINELKEGKLDKTGVAGSAANADKLDGRHASEFEESDMFLAYLASNNNGPLFLISQTKGDTVTTGGRSAINTKGVRTLIFNGSAYGGFDTTNTIYGGHIVVTTDGTSWEDNDADDNYGMTSGMGTARTTPAGNTVYIKTMAGTWNVSEKRPVDAVLNGKSYRISTRTLFTNPSSMKWMLGLADFFLFKIKDLSLVNYNDAVPFIGGVYKDILTVQDVLRVGKPNNAPFGVELAYNNEGGNVSWYSPDGTKWEFDTCGNVFRLFNYTTLKNFIIDKNGDASFPGHLNVIGALDVNGAIKAKGSSAVYGGDKIKMWTDNEGGNLEITSDLSNLTWQVDAESGILRFFLNDADDGNKKYFPLKMGGTQVAVQTHMIINNMGIFKDTFNNHDYRFYIGGKNAYTDTDTSSIKFQPCLQCDQFENSFQLVPVGDNVKIGTNIIPFQSITAKNIYNSSGLITSSDRNKKKDFEDITQEFADSIIDGLIPASFRYKDGDSGRTHYGLVAQDVEKLLDELGIDSTDFAPLIKDYPMKEIETKDGGLRLETDHDAEPEYFLRYEGFIGLIIKYIQGLKQENRGMKDKMSKLEDRLELLERRLDNI